MKTPSWLNQNTGLLFLRIAIAAVFIFAGISKLSNMSMVIGFFGSLGLPAFIAWLVALVETIGGIAILLGVWTRISALALAIIMVGAYFTAHIGQGFAAAQMVFVLFLVCLAIVATGPGKYAIKKKTTTTSTSESTTM